jgi:hypothetical protein
VLNTCGFSITETTSYHDEINVYFYLEKLFKFCLKKSKAVNENIRLRVMTDFLDVRGVQIWQNVWDKSGVSIFSVEEATTVSQIESV